MTPGRVALVAAVAAALTFGLSFPAVEFPDTPSYMEPARAWARGDGLLESPGRPLEYRLPMFPWMLGLILRLAGESPSAITVVQVLLHVGAMLLVRELVRPIHAPTADWCAAAAILWPPFLTAAATILQETLLAFLAALFAWTLWRAAEIGDGRWSLGAGLALGAAALGKSVILPLALPAALLLAIAPRRSWRRPALFALGVGVVVLPWALRNQRVLGRFELTNNNGGHTFLGGTVSNTIEDWYGFPEYRQAVEQWSAHGQAGQPILDRYLYGVATRRIREAPGRWLRLMAGRVVRFVLPARHWMAHAGLSTPGRVSPFLVVGSAVQAAAFLAAAVLALDVGRRRAPAVFLIAPAIMAWHLAIYAVMYASPRYNVTIGPLLACSIGTWWASRRRRVATSLGQPQQLVGP